MIIKKAIRTRDLPDAEIARQLERRFRDLRDCFNRRGVLIDPDNLHERTTRFKTPLTEAVRRLRRTSRQRKDK